MSYIDGSYWEATNRKVWAYAIINSNLFYNNTINTLASFEIERNLVSEQKLTFGNTCSSKLTLRLLNVEYTKQVSIYKGGIVDLAVGVDVSGATPRWYTFYIGEINITERRNLISNRPASDITLVCYDALAWFDVKYTPVNIAPSESTPVSLADVAQDIIASGPDDFQWLLTEGFSQDIFITSIPENVTCREMFGYIAGLQGCNCYLDIDTISTKFLTDATAKRISGNEQFLDEYTVDGDVIQISRVESGASNDDIAVYPSDGTLVNSVSYFCPYIHNDSAGQARVREIQESIIAFAQSIQSGATALNYTPMSVRWRGNPHLTIGDVVRVTHNRSNVDNYCLIMNETVTFDGGLSQTFKCFGDTQKGISFQMTPQMQQIERQISTLEGEIQAATEMLLNDLSVIDGVFSFTKSPSNNHNTGWKIESSLDQHYILANKNGIGFSSDGGQSFNAAAIWIDEQGHGHIAGEYITGLQITTEMLTFDPVTSDNVDEYAVTPDNITDYGYVTGDDVTTGITNWYDGLIINGNKISNITAIPGYTTLKATVDGKATVAQATTAGRTAGRTAANEQIRALTDAHGLTYIGSDGIYTGTINATQINLGFGGVNYALLGANSIGSYVDLSFASGGDPSYEVTRNVYSSTAADYSTVKIQPFFAKQGAKLTWGGLKNALGGGTGDIVMEVRYTSTTNYADSQLAGSLTFSASDRLLAKTTSVSAPSTAYYWLVIYCKNGTVYVNNALLAIFICQSVSGNAIINGTIKSLDGKTYFDLENSEIVTATTNGKTTIKSGEITTFSGTSTNNVQVSLKDGLISLSAVVPNEVNGELGQITMTDWYMTVDSKTYHDYGPCFLYNPDVSDGLVFGKPSTAIMLVSTYYGVYVFEDLTVTGTINNSSSEKYKKNISEYTGNALDLVTNAKIYSFLYKTNEDSDPLQYGVVIERECPQEIVGKTGDTISVYSMTALAWKAIQELSDKIKKLEEQL